jgi:trehalose utilization protein
MAIRTVVWGENIHEQINKVVAEVYPKTMHETIAAALNEDKGISATTAWLQQPEHGLSEARLAETDVLVWWGHKDHGAVADEIVERVAKRVWEGMGLIVLHSGHYSKIFKKLMGTPCGLKWREAGERERLWVINRQASANTLKSSLRKCMASSLQCLSRSKPCSSPGSRAAKCSAQV